MTTQTFEINVRALKAVACAVSSEETRYYLCGVNVEFLSHTVVMTATDGHGMIVARHKNLSLQHAPVIIPAKLIARIKLHKSTEMGALIIDGGKLTVDYMGEIYGDNAIDGTFPDYRRVFPKEVSGVAAQYASDQVAVFTKARRIMLANNKAQSPHIHHNGLDPAIVDVMEHGHSVEMVGVLMPFREPKGARGPYYSWATEYPAPVTVQTAVAA
jgi:DNA polymerase-3 subunit beta